MEIHHKLLILDDDADVAKTIARIAEGIGFAVRFCSAPADFFATLERWRPSHLAVDLVMPALDGMEVLRQLAERGCNAQVIVTSGMGTKVLESAQRSGVERGLAIAGILPQIFGIVLGGLTLAFFKSFPNHLGYTLLFVLTLIWFILGTVLIAQVKQVR